MQMHKAGGRVATPTPNFLPFWIVSDDVGGLHRDRPGLHAAVGCSAWPSAHNHNTQGVDGEETRPLHFHFCAFPKTSPVSSRGKHRKNTSFTMHSVTLDHSTEEVGGGPSSSLSTGEKSPPRCPPVPLEELCLGLFLVTHRNKHLCPLSAVITRDVVMIMII